MIQNYRYFLAVAEELSISRAAKKLHITQQCLSSFIQKLEEKHGVLLLDRKPRMRLTAAGEIFQRHCQKLQLLENNLCNELNEMRNVDNRAVNIGIRPSRSRFLLPLFVERFPDLCRRICLNVVNGTTDEFEKQVLDNSLDFFIGSNPSGDAALSCTLLLDEKIYLAVSESLLRQHFDAADIPKFQNGVDPRDFAAVPFITNYPDMKLFNSYLSERGVRLRSTLNVSGNMHIELVHVGFGAGFIPQMLLPIIAKLNENNAEHTKIHTFPIRDFTAPSRLCLVHSKDLFLTRTLQTVIASWKQLFSETFGTASDKRPAPGPATHSPPAHLTNLRRSDKVPSY